MSVFDDIADVAGEIFNAIEEGVEDAGQALFEGPGGLVGVVVAGASLYVQGPGALIPAIVAGSGATSVVNELIAHRPLTPEERDLARSVFEESLPTQDDRIILTNIAGIGGRAFTCPNISGEILINLGSAYADPLGGTSPAYPARGQLLVHELAHAWQIEHSSFVPGLVCAGIANQVRDTVDDGVYDIGEAAEQWSAYNLEQQATIVDRWFGEGRSATHRLFRYIEGNIRRRSTGGLTLPLSKRVANSSPARTPNRLDVFFVGQDGAIASVAWEAGVNNNAWSDGFPVTKPGAVRTDSPIVAIPRTPNRLDVFFVGQDGAIGSVAWEGGVNDNAWSDGFGITRPGAARAGSGLTCASRTSNRLDVFFVGQDGAIASVAWEAGVNNNAWSNGFPVTRRGAVR